ncbi:hypothetical protein B0F90DRAFT_1694580 [Multifurca ochricompacta]|uniref:Zn(2)-C6 fungal-type domain-containing protein n=1 Tax=Multifurca ochricompacta TaxID=376703 RepID=A0AAD4QRC7_9AGAM|nr:hypothetical protein B0F90DRAFT_1694580 [Multifurca ochricompacta]
MAKYHSYIDPPYQRNLPLFSASGPHHLGFPNASGQLPTTQAQSGQNSFHVRRDSLHTATTAVSLTLVASTDDLNASSSPPLLSNSSDLVHSSSNQPRRSRRDKMHIELSPDQPPTTQGRPRARVFVACIQCRGRKIRCDGSKPVCYHCSQRGGNEECTYDALPRRRGPDRTQGARTRGTRSKTGDGEPPFRRRRRRPTTVDQGTLSQVADGNHEIKRLSITVNLSPPDIMEDSIPSIHQQQNSIRSHTLEHNPFEGLEGSLRFSSTTSNDQTLTFESTSNGHPPLTSRDVGCSEEAMYSGANPPLAMTTYAVPVETQREGEQEPSNITPDPSVQFNRKIWWDHLLHMYAVSISASYGSLPLGQVQRDASVNQVIKDVRFIFRSSSYWFSFLNVPRFYNNLMDPTRRSRMQPSLLLSLLAVSTFLQSSERKHPEEGRRMAIFLRDEAQGALEASLNLTITLVSKILSFFEVCAHPHHQVTRIHSSLNILDSMIRMLAMTYLDAGNPVASTFARNAVPAVDASSKGYHPSSQHYPSSTSVPLSTQQHLQEQEQEQVAVDHAIRATGCSCDELSLGCQWPEAQRQVPLWVATPAWNRDWSEGEVKKEECRRLCWSALMLVSGHTSYAAAVNWRRPDLFMVEPSNYSILFPGESLLLPRSQVHSHATSGKDTVWALYIRAMLLWNACLRIRHDASVSDLDKRDFAMGAWMETEAIEKALQQHTCSIERAFMFNGREFLFNTRMCISYEFQRFVPHVLIGLNRIKSEEWLRAQGKRAKTVMLGMHTVTGNIKHNLAQRPWFVWWFMGQIFRALNLWYHDNSLTIALDVCKAFLEPIQFLTTIYPGPSKHHVFLVSKHGWPV